MYLSDVSVSLIIEVISKHVIQGENINEFKQINKTNFVEEFCINNK